MNKNNLQKIVGLIWVFIYLSILYKFIRYSGWGTIQELCYLNTSSTQFLNRFFPDLFTFIPKIEVIKDLICIVLSILFAFNITYSKKIFSIVMLYTILDALLSCYFINVEIEIIRRNTFFESNIDLFYRTLIVEYFLIFLSVATLVFLYKTRKKEI